MGDDAGDDVYETILYETILYEVDDRVATVTLNRPDKRNALNFPLRQDIVAALRRAEAADEVGLL